MTKEEIVTELLENYTWDVFDGNIWANENGILFIPEDDEDYVDPLLLPVGEWVERYVERNGLLILSDADRIWVEEQLEAHFTERYRMYLIEQMKRLDTKENT